MGTNCLIRGGVVLLVADDQRSSFMNNGHLLHMGVRLSFVCGSLHSLYPYTLGVPFPHSAVCLLRGTRLSVVRGFLRLLCLNILGVLLPILSTPLQRI